MNILIADDHAPFLTGLKHLIQHLYPEAVITEATNGIDALTLITEGNPFDLALIDLSLPGIDGFSLLRRLTQMLSLIPVLTISSSTELEDIEQVLCLGASGFIPKSFTPAELQHAIVIILSGGIYQPKK